MEEKIIRLPESELEIMQMIWQLHAKGEKNITANLIMRSYPEITRLKLTTVLTLITRLQIKGFVSVSKEGRSNCYTPLIAVEDYRKFALEDFITRVFMGNRDELISMLNND
jgi:BlaI family transcriptional regulator, penicillinase repressor